MYINTHPGWQSLTLHFNWPADTSSAKTSPLPVPRINNEHHSFLFFCNKQPLPNFNNNLNIYKDIYIYMYVYTNYSKDPWKLIKHFALNKYLKKKKKKKFREHLSFDREPLNARIINRKVSSFSLRLRQYAHLFWSYHVRELGLDLTLHRVPYL